MVINTSFKQYNKDAIGVKQITSIPGVIPGLLWPNCPQLLDPHVYTLPSCNRNTECCPPQTISFRPLPVNTLQFLGSNMWFLSTPIPNCPSFAFPQHNMLTNGEGMSAKLERQQGSDTQMEEDRSSGLIAAPFSPLYVTSNPRGMKNELGMNYCAIMLYSWHVVVWFLRCGPLLFWRIK